jgi:hypothetical protein
LGGELDALVIDPPPDVTLLIQNIFYLKNDSLTISDIIRSKILKDHEDIIKIFKLHELLQFGVLESSLSQSNRYLGQEVYHLKKYSKNDISETAEGRARLNLFRINQEV